MIINPTKNCRADCIHIKACRRLQKIARNKNGVYIARHCTEDCTAYESMFDYYKPKAVKNVAYWARDDQSIDIEEIMRMCWSADYIETDEQG